jgi:hypothetical protein
MTVERLAARVEQLELEVRNLTRVVDALLRPVEGELVAGELQAAPALEEWYRTFAARNKHEWPAVRGFRKE